MSNVNTNHSAIGFGRNNTLCKSDKPLHASLNKCNHQPVVTTDANVTYYQLRADHKCAAFVHSGFGVQLGLQLEDCVENLAQNRSQWFVSVKMPNATGLHGVIPMDLSNHGLMGASAGIVSSYCDTLAFGYNDIRNDKADNPGLALHIRE